METLEYYKLKDELGGLIKDEISKSLGNERDLQQRYIGIGLKVAATGIAAAVLTLGVFGIKSFYEVNSAIEKIPGFINKRADEEVTARFNSKNPVAQYETILLESAARSVAASIATRAERPSNISLEEHVSDVIVRALNDNSIKLATKLSLIDAVSTPKIRSISPSIDQAVITVTQQVESENPVNDRSVLRCLNYFSARNTERFVGEVEKIYDARSRSSQISLGLGRYALTLRKDYGEDFAKKLEKSEDPSLGYLLHIRNLKIGKVKQVNREVFEAELLRAFDADSDEGIGLSDIIDHISSLDEELDNSTEVVGQLIDLIREHALSKNLSLAVDDDSPEDMSFRFYTSDGEKGSASVDRKQFAILIRFAADQIRSALKRSKGEFTDPIRQATEFWFPRLDSDVESNSRKAGAFSLANVKKVRFIAPDGGDTPGSTLSSRAIVTTQGTGAETKIILKWNNEIGETKSMPIKTIVDLDPDWLQEYGIWSRVSNND